MTKLSYTTTREVTGAEIDSLISGTGAASWEWWRTVKRTGEGEWKVTCWDGESEGEEIIQVTLTTDRVVKAFERALELGLLDRDQSDVRDALEDDLGYLDAIQGDIVLQLAAYEDVMYG